MRRSAGGIAGSNPTGRMDVCLLLMLCVVTFLCDGPIPRPEESDRICVCVCVRVCVCVCVCVCVYVCLCVLECDQMQP